MATSVKERIAKNIESTLANLTTQAGYKLCIRRARQKNLPAHLSGFIFQLSPTDVPDPMIGTDEWKLSFAVVVYVIPAEDDDTPVDTYNNDIDATLHDAVMADFERGGLALNTIVQPALYFPPVEGDLAGITFLFEVHSRNVLDKAYLAAT